MIFNLVPEFFKYNSVVSVPLFSLVSYILVRQAPNFSFRKHTISESVFYLESSRRFLIFRYIFIFKTFLDLGFMWYLLNYYRISLTSLSAWILVFSSLFFGLLAFFREDNHCLIHRACAYGSGVCWSISEIILAVRTGNWIFALITGLVVGFSLLGVVMGTLVFKRKINTILESIWVFTMYAWIVFFVFRYL